MKKDGVNIFEQLSRVGEKLVKRCGSRDPFEIARQLGINVMLCDNFGSLKGMYRVIKRNRFIFLNNSLDENMLRIVCAHELGHDQLHRNMAKTTPIHEFMLYDMKSKPEYKANIVVAEILMDSNEVLRYISMSMDTQPSGSPVRCPPTSIWLR